MPGENIQDWSPTATDNATADSLINWQEGQARASVNNSARSMMAAHAKNRNLLNGSIVTTGTANAQAFLSGLTYTTVPTNLVVKLKIGAGLTNDGSATLNMDGIGPVLIKTANGRDLLGHELIAGAYTDFVFNGTNWIFLYSQDFVDYEVHGGGGIVIGQQIFKTPGSFTYTPTSVEVEHVIVECVGGGAGGGGGVGGAGLLASGSGGGGGGYSRKSLTIDAVGVSQPIVVGAGGAGGTTGAAGGTTSFGTLCVANGGVGGSSLGYPGGAGASPGTGDIAGGGGPGEAGYYNSNILVETEISYSGAGGSSIFGGGGIGVTTGYGQVAYGGNGTNYGGGGGGGVTFSVAVVTIGGNGAGGIVIVTEYGGRGAPGRDGEKGDPGNIGPPGPAGVGTGDVLVHGVPVAGQAARWFDTSHIEGFDLPISSTGDVKLTFKIVADAGWVMANDGSIGSTSSGANYANSNSLPLFTLLYDVINDANAPLQTSAGAATTRAAQGTASAAWTANCRLVLPKTLGRALGVAGAGAGLTSRALGSTAGSEHETVTIAKMPSHGHSYTGSGDNLYYTLDPNGPVGILFGGLLATRTTSAVGGGAPLDIVQPTTFLNLMIKL